VHVHRSISDDDGVNWQHEVVTAQVKANDVDGIFATSGMGGFFSTGPYAGRLMHSFVLRRSNNLLGAIAFSDDHGVTWKLGGEIPGGNESAVACLADGTLLFHSRARPFRVTGRSLDGGESITTLGYDHELPDPSDNGSLCVLKSGAVICTHNHDQDLRRRTVAKRSTDGGNSWPEAVVIEEESSGYSTSCELADGRIAIFFERFGYSELVFCRINLEDFSSAEELLLPQCDQNKIEFTISLRYIRPARNEKLIQEIGDLTPNRIPLIDMTQFSASERKEIGPSSGSASGDPVFTKEEFDQILGPVSPGLHLGDELRFSGRIQNHNTKTLKNLRINHQCSGGEIHGESLQTQEKITFMDLRYVLTEQDIETGVLRLNFQWSGDLDLQGRVEGKSVLTISISTGLSIK
jgi:sialidase-1